MGSFVKFTIYAHGNIIEGNSGPEYDRGPLKMVKIRIGSFYFEFLYKICQSIGIDPSQWQVEIIHRLCIQMTHGVSYSAIPINDDDDVECLIDVAKECKGHIYPDLYVRTSLQTSQAATQVNTSSYPVVETQSHSPLHHNQQLEAGSSTWCTTPRQDTSYQSPMHYEANEYF